MQSKVHMVVSQDSGTPTCYNPYSRNAQKATPHFGNPNMELGLNGVKFRDHGLRLG